MKLIADRPHSLCSEVLKMKYGNAGHMLPGAGVLCGIIFALSTNLQAQTQTRPDKQQDDEVLRVSTNLVTVPVIVKTRQGGYIPNLRQEDFLIYEDGVAQEISHFETVDKPFTVVLMLDMSDSTKIDLKNIQNAAISFLNQLRPDDSAIIAAFDRQFIRTEVTKNRYMLSDAISHVKVGGGTALYDAIDTTINKTLKQIPGRKAIILLTDGIDTSSVRTTSESTIRSAAEQYALIYPIQWDTPDDFLSKQSSGSGVGGVMYTTPSGEPLRKAYERGTRYLQLIARTSGGHFQYADTLENLNRSFSRIAEELRQQYGLGYYPGNQARKNGKRRIKVTVKVPDAVVHARDSYVYKADVP
jgi:Ca-activated chloride channel family protein